MVELITALTVILSVVSIAVSIISLRHSRQAINLSQQNSKSEAVMHFTDRFFDLLQETDGKIDRKILNNDGWGDRFWNLHSTEFYFFHNGILPTFMYKLWMVDLAELYGGVNGQAIRESHKQYLSKYSLGYKEMDDFFQKLYDNSGGNDENKSNQIGSMIGKWISENPNPSM